MAIESYVGGGPNLTLQFPQEPVVRDLGVTLTGGVRAYAWFFSTTYQADYTWWLTRSAQSAGTRDLMTTLAINRPSAPSFQLMDRDYLIRKTVMTPAAVTLNSEGELSTVNPIEPQSDEHRTAECRSGSRQG